jgi:GT2 family glycosyltransferase
MTPKVVVVVLNWKGEADTAECLDSLERDTSAAHTVLLMDNCSPDGSGDRLHARYPALPYLKTSKNLGYAGGNNVGVTWALEQGADYVMVLNNDTVVQPGCIGQLLAALEQESGMAAVAPTIVDHARPALMWYAGGHFSIGKALGISHRTPPTPTTSSLVPCTFLTGCCFLVRAEAWRTIGPFREDFFAYVEDAEWSRRAVVSGRTLGWVPAARIAHKVPAPGTPDSPFQIELRDRNRRRLVRDGYSVVEALRFACWFWPTRAVTAVRYLLTGDRARLQALWRGCRAP